MVITWLYFLINCNNIFYMAANLLFSVFFNTSHHLKVKNGILLKFLFELLNNYWCWVYFPVAIYLLFPSSVLDKYQDHLDKQGFQKCNMVREWETRYKNSEKNKDQGTNTAPRWRCWNWIQASFIILSTVNERICGEFNSCGLQGQRTKWSLTIE